MNRKVVSTLLAALAALCVLTSCGSGSPRPADAETHPADAAVSAEDSPGQAAPVGEN